MVNKEIFSFLGELKRNNNRDWFNENKEKYKKLNQDFHVLVNQIIGNIKQFDPDIGLLDAKDCTFRIYRDVRFSPDKSPYKTHMGAFIAPGGRKTLKAGYYFHLEPGNCLLAGGLWQPPSNILKSLRQDIFDRTDEFKELIYSKCFKKHFVEIMNEDKLKRAPKGFSEDFPDIDLLKYKSYTVMKKLPDEVLLSDKFEKEVIDVYGCLHHFNCFLNRSVEMTE